MQRLKTKPDLTKWINTPKNYQRALQLCNCKALIVNIVNDELLFLSDDEKNISILFNNEGSTYLFVNYHLTDDNHFVPQENVRRYRIAQYGKRKDQEHGNGKEPEVYSDANAGGAIIDL